MQKCNMGKILASKLDLMMDWIMWDLRGRCQGWIWDFWILQWKRLNRAHLFCWRSTSSQGQSWSIFEKFKRRGIAQCYIQSGDHELKKKKKKGIQTGIVVVNLSLFADDMIPYIENPKKAYEFGQVSGHKINTQTSLAFLYTNNKRSETEI